MKQIPYELVRLVQIVYLSCKEMKYGRRTGSFE